MRSSIVHPGLTAFLNWIPEINENNFSGLSYNSNANHYFTSYLYIHYDWKSEATIRNI